MTKIKEEEREMRELAEKIVVEHGDELNDILERTPPEVVESWFEPMTDEKIAEIEARCKAELERRGIIDL